MSSSRIHLVASAPGSGLAERAALSRQFTDVRFVGAGPDGTVMSAKRRDGGDEVELRFVQEHAQSDELLERWARYQLVDHPHVISLGHVEPAGPAWCAVLETGPRSSLAEAEVASWGIERRITLLTQLAGALAAAHDVGLWHGELSPSSVALDGEGRARLEFSGVRVSGGPLSGSVSGSGWQAADAAADLEGLGRVAEFVFGDPASARGLLPWIGRLLDTDPARRPSASDVVAWLGTALEPRHHAGRQPAEERTRATSSPGERIGRFRLERQLGEGGMGSVYLATDIATGQRVALKRLKSELLDDDTARYRFRKEARVLKAVRSPYIANLIDAEINDSMGYIALEYVNGKNLSALLSEREAPLPEALALQIVADLCRALIEPHRRGIVHRDVKPENVLVTGSLDRAHDIAIKLCDFGIASGKVSSDTLGMTQDGRLWGTPLYMSPEQCRAGAVSPATDVYGLGLTLFELCAGRPPFQSDELVDLLRQQMHDPAPDLRQRASVSDATAALVARALEKSPGDRFADAEELLEQIERIRSGQASVAATVPAPRSAGSTFAVEFSADLRSSPAELWPFVSNTDRMNEVVGLPPVAVDRARVEGSTRTFLSNRVLGIEMRWREHPFEWIEGRSWSVFRVCEKGVTRWYRVQLELEALPAGGTRLRYRMEFEPVLRLLAFLVRFEVGVKQKAKLLTMFRRVDELVQQGGAQRIPSPHAAAKLGAQRVETVRRKFAELHSREIDAFALAALERHVLEAPDAEIARIRPLRLARAHGLDERAVAEACLFAARRGVFELLWDVSCPLCQIPSTFEQSLAALATHANCPACELQFPLDFARSVELVFRVAPEVRPNEARTYCIGGPAHSPHVAAQLNLAPGEGRVISLELSEGRHRIRSAQLPGVLELDVSSRHGQGRADLVIGSRLGLRVSERNAEADPRLAFTLAEPVIELGSGRQALRLRNEREHEVTLRVERTADRDDALTAARAWSMPRFREWFPGEVLESGRLVAVGNSSFLALRVCDHQGLIERHGDALALADTLARFDRLHAAAERHGGQLVSASMDLALAKFERPADALNCCLELAPQIAIGGRASSSLALHRGPVVATTIDARLAYYGKTLVETLALSASVESGEIVVSSTALAEQQRIQGIIEQLGAGARIRPAPKLGAAAWCVHVSPTPPSDADAEASRVKLIPASRTARDASATRASGKPRAARARNVSRTPD